MNHKNFGFFYKSILFQKIISNIHWLNVIGQNIRLFIKFYIQIYSLYLHIQKYCFKKLGKLKELYMFIQSNKIKFYLLIFLNSLKEINCMGHAILIKVVHCLLILKNYCLRYLKSNILNCKLVMKKYQIFVLEKMKVYYMRLVRQEIQ